MRRRLPVLAFFLATGLLGCAANRSAPLAEHRAWHGPEPEPARASSWRDVACPAHVDEGEPVPRARPCGAR